jgi:Lrp/AsnC family leucine-responsive transcriptional regulator
MLSNLRRWVHDATDLKILRHLVRDGRITWAELGSALTLSGPAAADRVKRLERDGVILGYTALLDPEHLGLAVTAFVALRLALPKHRAGLVNRVRRLDAVLECHHVAGDDDYVLKVRVATLRDLEELVSGKLKSIEGIVATRTTIVLSSVKETPAPPLGRVETFDSE